MYLNNKYTQSKIFKQAEHTYEYLKILVMLFWMPLIVLTALYFILD